MKKKSSNIITGMAIGMAAGAALGAFSLGKMSGVSSTRLMNKTRKTLKKNADKAIDTISNIANTIPKFLG